MDLVSIPANPVPEDVVTGVLTTSDGVSLRYARWRPPPGRKGTVCLFQGRGEFIEKYFETVRELRARGFAVAALDWRGQGGSQRQLRDRFKGHVGDFSEYERDIETFMNEVVLPDCPPPLFALGHSMGGTVLLRIAKQGRRWFDRMVLLAPMLALQGGRGSGLARSTVRLMRLIGMGPTYVPGGAAYIRSMGPFVGNPLTSDPVRHARTMAVLQAEPELGLGPPTVTWLGAAYRAMDALANTAYAASIRQPLMLVAAGNDRVVSTPAIEEFAIHLRAGSHLIVPGAQHEILMEQDRYRAQFWAAFDAFVPGTPLY